MSIRGFTSLKTQEMTDKQFDNIKRHIWNTLLADCVNAEEKRHFRETYFMIIGVMSCVKEMMQAARENLNQELDVERITYDTDFENRDLDEVVVKDVDSVHIERMTDDGIWMGIYPKDGKRLCVSFYTTPPGTPDDDDSDGPKIYGHAELGA